MIALGIESTAHTFGVATVDERGNILSNSRDMFKPELGKGFTPYELAEHHYGISGEILDKSLKEANITWDSIDVVAFSQGMGIPNSLKVGAALARYLSLKYSKPLIGVNHGIAHIEIGKLKTGSSDPVIVYLSGGNSQILAYVSGRYRVFGETQDIPVGNALDVLARELGLPMPGGPEIEKIAKNGGFTDLPYVVKGMDMSFTGIMTAAIEKFKEGVRKEDIAYSMQEVCFSMLTEVTERALAHTNKKEVLLVGGVAANKRLQEMMKVMCEERGANFYVVPQEYAGDNGSNIAWAGILVYNSNGKLSVEDSRVKQNWRTEDVEITWLK
ncbi:MAG: bifunctional N(6)-L-threonylcarbamoyladenine synthase/serine/threonine protein kinase [Candidatus Aenigmarchaeota archaeon]|nr:bifunctional N(6)-L-threonylcarbamoyladenine synthase/serine/threonine protein kinase [Candidatus Aenigmarchaeota archaeon]